MLIFADKGDGGGEIQSHSDDNSPKSLPFHFPITVFKITCLKSYCNLIEGWSLNLC